MSIYKELAIRSVVTTLTGMQRKFFEAYITDPKHNATKAAKIAGYANPDKAGPRLRNSKKIVDAIESVLARQTMSRNEVLARLSAQAAAEYAEFIMPSGHIDLPAMKTAGKLHLIKSIHHIKETKYSDPQIEVTFTDSQTAIFWLGKHYAQFSDINQQESEAQTTLSEALTEIANKYNLTL